MNNEIIDKFKDKILGWASYGNNTKYYVNDFVDINKLSPIIAETYSSESRISSDGITFLKEYYGLGELSKQLEKNGGVESDLMNSNSILNWLENLSKDTK